MNRLRTDGVTWRQVDEEIVVLNLETSRYLSLNGTGVLLWNAMEDGGSSTDELVDLVLATFDDVDRGTAESDVRAFLDECAGFGLIDS